MFIRKYPKNFLRYLYYSKINCKRKKSVAQMFIRKYPKNFLRYLYYSKIICTIRRLTESKRTNFCKTLNI